MDLPHLNELETLRALIAESPIPIGLYVGPEMHIAVVNKAILQTWDRDESVIGKTFHDALPELNSQPFEKLLEQVYSTGVAYHASEDRVDLVVGGKLQIFYFNFTYQPLKYKNGKVWGILNTATDVTAQVMARQKLVEAEERLRLALDSADLGTWSINAHTKKTFPSARTKELFGFESDEEMSFEASINAVAEDYRDKVIATIDRAFTEGGSYDTEYPIINVRNGKQRWVRSTGKVYYDADNKPNNFSGVIMDITDRKEEEIRKNDFIAMVSHELKTPLTSIKSYIQISLIKVKKQGDEFLENALSKADKQIVKMTKMIRGFLDLAKLESGKISIQPEQFDIELLVKETVNDIQFISDSHFFEVTGCGPLMVNADRYKIGQVIENFLSNAMKYSPKETIIEVKCNVADNHAVVSVVDKGIGVKQKDQEKLFNRFYRVDNDIIKNVAGFGIGLYIAGEIIQLHNGRIWVESEEFEGAIFSFSLPLAQA
ncbi:PAS domain-containing sensor histidine kinase [Mucilaginibacter limnophilus]|uniref:histidine kinase n=1 Tax=Mucilaginibacter limnophilus TaxID=1932778 RepID=A0A437MYJ9_9SPHI|nr:PAS domain-containing sensor histidine kinase [Mucilaginibacter limnophilus]RVU02728.1 PAS domain-containing sensor histidine kinase [Mucilaginibacter limnophilus]